MAVDYQKCELVFEKSVVTKEKIKTLECKSKWVKLIVQDIPLSQNNKVIVLDELGLVLGMQDNLL